MPQSHLLQDTFVVDAINPDGKVFSRGMYTSSLYIYNILNYKYITHSISYGLHRRNIQRRNRMRLQ